MKIVKIYETSSTDGYTSTSDGLYFLDKTVALAAGKRKHGNYSSGPIGHDGIEVEKDKYLLLKSTDPILIANSESHKEEIRKAALSKLSSAEREILGL